MSKEEQLDHFSDVFERVISDAVHGYSEVACHLSGGYDTRTVLSVLLKNGIQPTVITYQRRGHKNIGDIEISSLIADEYNLHHVIDQNIRHEDTHRPALCLHKKHAEKYDIILSGFLMSELFEYYQYIDKRAKDRYVRTGAIPYIHSALRICNNLFIPAADYDVINALQRLDKKLRREKIIQLHITERNAPGLAEFPYNKKLKSRFFLSKVKKVFE